MKPPKNRAAVSLGRRGGLARAANQTEAERKQLAQRAIRARWDKRKPPLPTPFLCENCGSAHNVKPVADRAGRQVLVCSAACLEAIEDSRIVPEYPATERIDYSCGCSATGIAPLPRRCAVHPKAEPVAIMEVK